jgi:hypothetical protein
MLNEKAQRYTAMWDTRSSNNTVAARELFHVENHVCGVQRKPAHTDGQTH